MTSKCPTPSSDEKNWGSTSWSRVRDALASESASGETYRGPSGVGTRTIRISRRSRDNVDWVTAPPFSRSKSLSSSWLPTVRDEMRFRIARWRSRLFTEREKLGGGLRVAESAVDDGASLCNITSTTDECHVPFTVVSGFFSPPIDFKCMK